MSIRLKDIKKLYSRSAGQCNICKRDLIEDDVQLGEMAHIIAKNSGGTRAIQGQENINTYDNLILLCPTHHTIVDAKENAIKYPVERLLLIKSEHENLIKSRLNISKEYSDDLESLNILFHFIPILDFRRLVLELPSKVHINIDPHYMFNLFVEGNPHAYPFWDNQLCRLWDDFLKKFINLDNWILGSLRGMTLITMHEMMNSELKVSKNNPCYNIYVPSDNCDGYLILNHRFLSCEQIDYVELNVTRLVQECIYAHTDLINYVRYNFRDVEWGRR